MVSSTRNFVVKTLLFGILLQNYILISNAEGQCVTRVFEANQKIVVEYFIPYNDGGYGKTICQIIAGSNGLISMKYRVGADVTGQGANGEPICSDANCTNENRELACYYKLYENLYNDCNSDLPPINKNIMECKNQGAADDILYTNGNLRVNYGIDESSLPAIVVNEYYDPCFTDYSFEGMKTYFCGGYSNTLPLCQ